MATPFESHGTAIRSGRAAQAPRWKAPRPVLYATVAFALVLFATIVALDNGITGGLLGPLRHVPGGDKTLHFVLLGSMALLLNATLGGARFHWGPFVFLRGSAIVAVVATLEEFSQRWVVRRAFSLDDLIYDYLGILFLGQLGAAIGWWLRRRSSRAPSGES